jgi:hypothetical protein
MYDYLQGSQSRGGGGTGGGDGLSEAQVDARIETLIVPSTGIAAATVQLLHGSGADQTSTLQSLLTAMQGTGGTILLQGDIRLDSEVTYNPTASVSLTIMALAHAKIYSGGTQAHKFFNFDAASSIDADVTFKSLSFLGGGAANASDTDYRFIKVADFRKVRFLDLFGEYCRGMGFTSDQSVDVLADRCTLVRNLKDGISITQSRTSQVTNCSIFGCGDNPIAIHTKERTNDTFGATALSVSTGSPTIDVTFPASNSARVGDTVNITADLALGGINMRRAWTIVTKPTGATATFTAEKNSSATTTGGSVAFSIGASVTGDRSGGVTVTNNKIVQGNGGIRVLGGANAITIKDNHLLFCYGEGIGIYDPAATAQGDLDPQLIEISGNTIADLIRTGSGTVNASGQNTAIYVAFRYKTPKQVRVINNTIDLARTVTLGVTTPADLMSDYIQPFGGGFATESGFWTSAQYYNTAFSSSQPINGVHAGVSIECLNAGDRDAVYVAGNSFAGVKTNQGVRRTIPFAANPVTVSQTDTATKVSIEPTIAALTIDLAPAAAVGLKARVGAVTNTGTLLEARLRRNDGIGVDGYVATTWGGGTAFASNTLTTDATANKDFEGTSTTLVTDGKRSMDAVLFMDIGSGSPGTIEFTQVSLVVDHADNDSDYVVPVAQSIYDPEGIFSGAYLGEGVISAATWAGMSSGEKAGRNWTVM